MRKLRVGQIYYWCEPKSNWSWGERDLVGDRFCVVTAVEQYHDTFTGGYECTDRPLADFLFGDEYTILGRCFIEEFKAGRLHYIGRL